MTPPFVLEDLTAPWPEDSRRRPGLPRSATPKLLPSWHDAEGAASVSTELEQRLSMIWAVAEQTLARNHKRSPGGAGQAPRASGESLRVHDSQRTDAEREISMLRQQLREQRVYFEGRLQRLERLLEEMLSRLPIPDRPAQEPRPPACLDELRARYEIPELRPLLQHFVRRPALPQLLVAAADELKRRFEDTRLALLAREDDRFIIAVETALEVEEAAARLARFRREWWHSRIEVDDRIVVKLRYI